MITVLHIFSGDLWAGAEVMIYNLLRKLKEYNNLKIIALSMNEGVLTKKLEKEGTKVVVVNEDMYSFPFLCWKAYREFKKEKIDIIHSHRCKENMLAFLLGRLKGIKNLVSTFHGWGVEYFEQNRKVRPITRIDYFILRNFFSRVVAVSHDIKKGLIENYYFRKDKLAVIHNGIEINNLTYHMHEEPMIHIGSVGRLMPQKDYLLFLEIAARLVNEIKNIQFSILGDGPLWNELAHKSKELKIVEKVEFLKPRKDPFPYYRSLDIYLNTSVFEGIPLSILESMSVGLPVIAPKVGGIPEIITDGIDGIILEGRDPQKYVKACLELIRNKEQREKIGELATQTIKDRFSVESMTKRYRDLYHSLLNHRI